MEREIWFRSNSPTHRWLSNFYASPIDHGGVTWPTVEHAYQAMKTTVEAEREAIRLAPRAVDAKRLGHTVTMRPDWDADRAMRHLLRLKFTGPLAEWLQGTGSAILIEDNRGPWGGRDGGENKLGVMLMELRAEQ